MNEKLVIGLTLAVLALIVFPIAIACQSHLFADGAYFFVKIMETGKVGAVGGTYARLGHHLLTQGPIILARQLGLLNGRALSCLYGAVLFYFPWLLYASACMLFLYVRRPIHALLTVFLYLILLLFAGFFIISESHLAAAFFLFTLAFLTCGNWQPWPFQWGIMLFGLVGFSLYEAWAIYFPVLFAILVTKPPPRPPPWLVCCLGFLYAVGMSVNAYAVVASPVAANRQALWTGFLTHWSLVFLALAVFVGAMMLAVGPTWFGKNRRVCVLSRRGHDCSHASAYKGGHLLGPILVRIGLAAVITALGCLGVFLGYLGNPRSAYTLRILNLGLPLLFAVSLVHPVQEHLEKPSGSRLRLLKASVFSLLIVLTCAFIFHATGFRAFRRRLQGVLERSSGYMTLPKDLAHDIYGWTWTYPSLSLLHYVEESSAIRAIVFNPSADWEPFGPKYFQQLKDAATALGLPLENRKLMKQQREHRGHLPLPGRIANRDSQTNSDPPLVYGGRDTAETDNRGQEDAKR